MHVDRKPQLVLVEEASVAMSFSKPRQRMFGQSAQATGGLRVVKEEGCLRLEPLWPVAD